ncbi:DUF937 domain-containing protein [Myxacorys almedinensis]|uniref:DUF937 domain-containing protein n=1 Tax=Myxacorys almedinensis A TaxID=2690445 RepID=A0A8J8CKF1_9CYAN|nr:DUF937 domain-containing protein [Myxacorys almedinensis]NDJ19818.1 DUF937 domain-containing protein [Myxacorys almedinensis A]
MSLFDQILGAVSNPQQQASTDQLGSILGVAQQVAGSHGIDGNATQAIMSVLGGHVRSALQNQQGNNPQDLVNQFAGLGNNPQAVQSLFPGGQQQQVAQDISQRTGFNTNTIVSMLPVLVPLALNLLKTGSATQSASQAGNPVLNAFLDSNQDGKVDLGDAMGLAGQFLNQRR